MNYIINERWRVSGQLETYRSEHKSRTSVAHYIKDWLESWQESAAENGYKFLGAKTDSRSFAKVRIQTGELFGEKLVDTFSLKVSTT